MSEALSEKVRSVATAIGVVGTLPLVRAVPADEMRLHSSDNARPARALIRDGSGEMWVDEEQGLDDETIIHELTHHFLRTSWAAGSYPHQDSDVDGHGPLFAAVSWALCDRIVLSRNFEDYDLGRARKPGDRLASVQEKQWARRWVVWSHRGTAEDLAAQAIRDYRRWYRWRLWKASIMAELPGLLRFAVTLAVALLAPEILSRLACLATPN